MTDCSCPLCPHRLVEMLSVTAVPRRAWTVAEVAQSCGVGRSTVYGWIERGDLRAFRSGSIVRITDDELVRFLGHREAA